MNILLHCLTRVWPQTGRSPVKGTASLVSPSDDPSPITCQHNSYIMNKSICQIGYTELLHAIMPMLHPCMHQSRIITPHCPTLSLQRPYTHPPSNVILQLHHMQYADHSEEHLIERGSGRSGTSSLSIVDIVGIGNRKGNGWQ